MSEAITKAAEMALDDLTTATSFTSKKARDRQPKTLAALRAALSQAGQGGQGEAADHLFAEFGDGPTDEQCKDLWFRYPSLREWHKRTYAAQPAPVPAPVASVEDPKLRKAVFSVLEGCTLPHYARKTLEAAYYAQDAQQPAPAVPAGWVAHYLPADWTPGANEFKDWCTRWFGPDSDEDHLLRAAMALLSAAPKPEAGGAA